MRLRSHIFEFPSVCSRVDRPGRQTGEPPDGHLVAVLVEEPVQGPHPAQLTPGLLCRPLLEITDDSVLPQEDNLHLHHLLVLLPAAGFGFIFDSSGPGAGYRPGDLYTPGGVHPEVVDHHEHDPQDEGEVVAHHSGEDVPGAQACGRGEEPDGDDGRVLHQTEGVVQ